MRRGQGAEDTGEQGKQRPAVSGSFPAADKLVNASKSTGNQAPFSACHRPRPWGHSCPAIVPAGKPWVSSMHGAEAQRGQRRRGEVSGLADAGTLHEPSAALTCMGLLCLGLLRKSLLEVQLVGLPCHVPASQADGSIPPSSNPGGTVSGASSRELGHGLCSVNATWCLNLRRLTVPGSSGGLCLWD